MLGGVNPRHRYISIIVNVTGVSLVTYALTLSL